MDLLISLIFVCPLLFLAGIVDGIAGGGGIIALPTYILTGMPLNVAYGCNKMQSCIGTTASLARYAKSKMFDLKPALVSALFAIAGSFISTRIMIALSDNIKNIIIVVFMVFIITLTFVSFKVKSGTLMKRDFTAKNILTCIVIGFVLGLYDGFFGPGGGTVGAMLFGTILNYDLRVGNGNSKFIIVVSNFIALISYIVHGYVLYSIAIPATIANVIGSYIGASLAVKNGTKLVKRIMIIVVVFLLAQVVVKTFL